MQKPVKMEATTLSPSLSDGDGRHDRLPDSLRPAGCRGFGVLDDDVLDIDHVHCGEEQMFREKMRSCTSSLR